VVLTVRYGLCVTPASAMGLTALCAACVAPLILFVDAMHSFVLQGSKIIELFQTHDITKA
jgi:hypothetical protein